MGACRKCPVHRTRDESRLLVLSVQVRKLKRTFRGTSVPSHRSEHKCLPSAGHCARDLTLDSEGLVLSSLSMPAHWMMSCLSPRERKPLLPTPTPAARPGLVPAQSKYPQTRDSRIVLWVCGQLLEVLAGHRWFLERESMAGLSVLLFRLPKTRLSGLPRRVGARGHTGPEQTLSGARSPFAWL